MDTSSDTQAMLVQAVRQMLERHLSTQFLCEGRPKPSLWPQMVEIGFTAAEFPAARGGLEIAFADLAPALAQVGRNLATTYLVEFAVMGGWLAGQCAAPEASGIMPQIMSGQARVALAIGEYGSGGDISHTTTRAVRTGAGWTLQGRKAMVVGGNTATHVVVSARLEPVAGQPHGAFALFLLPTHTSGLTTHAFELYDGSGAADFDLRDVTVAADSLLASGDTAINLTELALDRGRAALSHEIVGLVERVSEITLDYVKTRTQFGQPIGAFQTMQHRMAEMAMDIELARSCAQIATDAITAEHDASARMQAVSAAMASICGCARRVGQSAVQAHGGIALTQEYVVGHYFKRLTMLERYLGNSDYHFERYCALAEV